MCNCVRISSLGCLLPALSREEAKRLVALEEQMRLRTPPLSGRDHWAFRSSVNPCLNVVDGDLCQQFSNLSAADKKSVAQIVETRAKAATNVQALQVQALMTYPSQPFVFFLVIIILFFC